MAVTFEDIAKAWELWSEWFVGRKVRKQTVTDVDIHASLYRGAGEWDIAIMVSLHEPRDESGLSDDEHDLLYDSPPFAFFYPSTLDDLLLVLNGGRTPQDNEWVLADEMEAVENDE